MHVHFSLDPHDVLVVHLREGDEQTTVSVRPSQAGAASLARALDDAMTDGYGECYWPALQGGQYWWMFKRDEDRVEVVAMWTRGGASLWEHVFRATDGAVWLREHLDEEFKAIGMGE